MSEAEKKDKAKREALVEAKKKWDEVKVENEKKKYVLSGENDKKERVIGQEELVCFCFCCLF